MEKTMKKNALKEKFGAFDISLLVVLVVYALILFVLFYWAVITSVKSQNQFYYDKVALPTGYNYNKFKKFDPLITGAPVWNFGTIFSDFFVKVQTPKGSDFVGVDMMIVYSILYAGGCALCNTLAQCLTAYTCAKFPCKISSILYDIVIVVMIIPIVGSLPAEVQLAKDLHIYDSILGQWIMKSNFLGIYFMVFYASFRALPNTYMEAGKIDGAGNFYIMTRISLPLVRNEFFTILLINFIAFWNDYQIPLLYLPSHPTIAYGIYNLSVSFDGEFSTVPMRMAGAVSMLLPILVLFVAFHKRLLGNLTVGGIKG